MPEHCYSEVVRLETFRSCVCIGRGIAFPGRIVIGFYPRFNDIILAGTAKLFGNYPVGSAILRKKIGNIQQNCGLSAKSGIFIFVKDYKK